LNGTVATPPPGAGVWRNWRAFAGPALLIGVGYMDPGNWGTDLQAGAQFRYSLLWVVALASGMAVVLQVLSARLGLATGRDLAQACRAWSPAWTRWPNWLGAEVAIVACDLAEVLGSAVALNLLFHVPLLWAVGLTTADVLLLLVLQRIGMRPIEAVVGALVAVIAAAFALELFVLPRTAPDLHEIGAALLRPGLGQVVLALQLPFAMFPLLVFTSRRTIMGDQRSGPWLLAAGWGSALLITGMDLYGLPDALRAAAHVLGG
jgi:manganese transport protein